MSIFSMNEVTTFRWTLEQDVERYRRYGYQGLGAWRQKLADFGEDAAVEMLSESGLVVTNLMWAGGFTGNDGRTLGESVEDATEAIRMAAALEAGCLVAYAGGRNNHTHRHAGRLLRMAIDELLPAADDADVTLAIEPMHPACAKEWTFLTDLTSTLSVIQAYDSPRLKIAFDAYHFGRDPTALGQLAELVPHIAIVRLGDRIEPYGIDHERRLLGTGRLRLAELVHSLRTAGYSGDFDVLLTGRHIDPNQYDDVLRASLEFHDQALVPVTGG